MAEVTWRQKWEQLSGVGCLSSRESLKLLDEVEALRPLVAAGRICQPPQSVPGDRPVGTRSV